MFYYSRLSAFRVPCLFSTYKSIEEIEIESEIKTIFTLLHLDPVSPAMKPSRFISILDLVVLLLFIECRPVSLADLLPQRLREEIERDPMAESVHAQAPNMNLSSAVA